MTATVDPAGAANGAEPAVLVTDDGRVDAADEALARQLAERAQAEGLSLTGPGGLLGRLTKVVLESALEGEMDAHLGYGRHDPAGRDGGNSRNGKRAKTVVTDVGTVQIEVPRDRDASFEPRIVAKRQRRLGGVDDMVVSLVAKGLTTGEVQAHLGEIYGVEVSRETISNITDRVLDGLAEWQSRPLDAVYAVLFIDVINVKIRDGNVANRPIYVALAVTVTGTRDILGLWAGEHGDGAGKAPMKRNRFILITGADKSINRALEAKARALAGIKGYITNIPDPTPEFVIGAYHQLWHIEKAFRMSKHDLRARPIYHYKRDSIEAHLTVVFAALAVTLVC